MFLKHWDGWRNQGKGITGRRNGRAKVRGWDVPTGHREAMRRELWRKTGDRCTGGGSAGEGLGGQAGLALELVLHPGPGVGVRWCGGHPCLQPRRRLPPANALFFCSHSGCSCSPNALASLCLRSPAHRGLPSPKPTSPWSLLPPCLHSLARAASGHTPPPLPGTAVARQPGVRYPAPLGPGGQGRREQGQAGDRITVPIPLSPQLLLALCPVGLWDEERDD